LLIKGVFLIALAWREGSMKTNSDMNIRVPGLLNQLVHVGIASISPGDDMIGMVQNGATLSGTRKWRRLWRLASIRTTPIPLETLPKKEL
jgi:hypothetical protein